MGLELWFLAWVCAPTELIPWVHQVLGVETLRATTLGLGEYQWGWTLAGTIRVLPIPSNQMNEVLILEEPEVREFSNLVLGCLVMAQGPP